MYFGIGWHKTGTTSLTEAFKLLGMKARHHPFSMYREYKAGATRFDAFEDNAFVCDAIVHVIYRELDRHYPGSKFIMTTRPLENWLESVKTHFQKGNAARDDLQGGTLWDHNNEARHVHGIHEMMYGRRTFNAAAMRDRYLQHEAGILAYFKDRADDLLVMDIENKESFNWESLCDFRLEEILESV